MGRTFGDRRWQLGLILAASLVASFAIALPLSAADDPADSRPAGDEAAETIVLEQEQLADKFRRFEDVLLRMAEMTAETDPERAALLRRVVAQSKDRLVGLQFERLVELLGQGRLAVATENQQELRQDLQSLLDLLLSEDRARRLESEQARIRAALKEVNQLIKQQRAPCGETDRGGSEQRLAGKQGELAERTDKLAKDLKSHEEGAEESPGENPDEPAEGDKPSDAEDGESGEQPTDPQEGAPQDGEQGDPQQGDPQQGDPQQGDPQQGDPQQGDPQQGDPQQGDPQQGDPQQGDPQQGDPQQGDPQQGDPQQGDPQQGDPQQQGEQQSSNQQVPARERLEEAQRRMREAQQELEEARREQAPRQEAALRELERAKAHLEEVLRQLREEEIERMLAMLEARFRKMLKLQIEIYEGTRLLDAIPEDRRDRSTEVQSAKLSREEAQLVVDADKLLTLLREEGTAVALPEAVEQMREDMHLVVERLAKTDVGEITQSIEQDIITALEEMIAAVEQAQQEQQEQQQQQQPQGEPEDPSLIDQLAELKMIRALQMRVNRRTERFRQLIDGEQAESSELLDALAELAEREDRIFRATRDIAIGRNR